MNRQRLFKWLRSAWTVGWLVVAGLLVVLWARSYQTADRLHGRIWFPHSFILASKEGRVTAIPFRWHGATWEWDFVSYPVDDDLAFPEDRQQYRSLFGVGWIANPSYPFRQYSFTLPDGSIKTVTAAGTASLPGYGGPIVHYWALAVLAIAVSAAPWIRWRFSLKTMLLITAILSGLLELGVWLVRG